MIDWVNAVLRTVMCMGFLLLVVRPMLLAFSRKEVNRLEIEDAAESSVHSAFDAWRIHHGRHYYDNPEYAEMMASNPNLELPDLSQPAPEPVPPVELEVKKEDNNEVTTETVAEIQEPSEASEPPVGEVAEGAPSESTSEVAKESEKPVAEVETVVAEEDENSMEAMKARLAAEKKKAKPPSIPPELMNNANSFDDKLMLVQMIVQQEQGRVAGVLKKMIQGQ
jgi:type IV secretory pathway VirB10-like protein